jgi:hypothetical protein
MIRKTNTEKWKDAWFTGLSPTEKLVFVFLTENCDIAGVYEINLNLMANLIGITVADLKKSLGSLQRSFVPNKKGTETRKIWLKKFLLHQNCLPLQSDNEDHMKIKFMLESSLNDFDNPKDMLQIIESVAQPKVIKKEPKSKKFKAPEWIEFWEYYKSIFDNESTAQSLYDHYISVGWTVGNKKMVDWKASIRKNIPNHKSGKYSNTNSSNNKGVSSITRTNKLKDASESFLNEGMIDG